jgi:hypothetical protein
MKIRRNKTRISDHLKEISMHMIEYVDDPEDMRDLLKLASFAWNITFFDDQKLPKGPRPKIQEVLRAFRQDRPWVSDIEMLELEDQLMKVYQLKNERFPDVPNIIQEVFVRREGDMNHIEVASMSPEV